jgi:transcription antitermination factor NusG
MEHDREHREHGGFGGVAVRNRVDTVMGDGVTVAACAPGANGPECGSIPEISPEFKPATMRGGARAGAGRPRKPASVALVAPGAEGARWYVAAVDRMGVRAEAGQSWAEAWESAVQALGFEAVVPQYRTKDDVLAMAFPGYALVEFDRRDPAWRVIPHLGGVRRLIGPDAERPTPVAWMQAAWVMAQFGEHGQQRLPLERAPAVPLAVGAMVRVVAGLGVGWAGVVSASDGRSVWLRLAGRTVRVAQAAVAVCSPYAARA